MRFKTGEKVSFLKEVGGGIVKSYKNEQIVIVDDDGFDREFLEMELVKIHGDQSNILHDDFDIKDVIEETVSYNKDLGDVYKKKDFWEIDLHTHAFMDSERGFTNGELLNKQLLEFTRFFREEQEDQIRKLVVSHGVGVGVLEAGVRHALAEKVELVWYDGYFRSYGKGGRAIE